MFKRLENYIVSEDKGCKPMKYLLPIVILGVTTTFGTLMWYHKPDIFQAISFYSKLNVIAGVGFTIVSILCAYNKTYSWLTAYIFAIAWVIIFLSIWRTRNKENEIKEL